MAHFFSFYWLHTGTVFRGVGRNKPVRALSAGLVFPALRLLETTTLRYRLGGLIPAYICRARRARQRLAMFFKHRKRRARRALPN
ncbi:MAG: hypothetical protein ACXV8O_17515 [Methylobacter sp.]